MPETINGVNTFDVHELPLLVVSHYLTILLSVVLLTSFFVLLFTSLHGRHFPLRHLAGRVVRARIRFRAAYPVLSEALDFAGSFTSSVILLLWLQPKLDPTPSATAPEPLGVFIEIPWPNGTISTYWLKDKDSVYKTMPAIMAEVVINGWSIDIETASPSTTIGTMTATFL
ncbi:unnamed protein product [Penicillium pancosmium]